MADASVLKELVVALRWDVGEAAFKKAISSVGQFVQQLKQLDKSHDDLAKKGKTTWSEFAKQVTEFGQKALVAGVAVEELVKRQTQMFENLFFLSQRTGASVQNLINFADAAGAINTSADAAKSAVDRMKEAIKSDPGVAAGWRALGINPNEQATKLLGDYAKAVQGMNYRIQMMWADTLNIPRDIARNILLPGARVRQERQEARFGAADANQGLTSARLDKISADSVEFNLKMQVFYHTLEDIARVSLDTLLPVLSKLVSQITWVVDKFGWLNNALGGLPGVFIELAGAAGLALKALKIIGALTGARGMLPGVLPVPGAPGAPGVPPGPASVGVLAFLTKLIPPVLFTYLFQNVLDLAKSGIDHGLASALGPGFVKRQAQVLIAQDKEKSERGLLSSLFNLPQTILEAVGLGFSKPADAERYIREHQKNLPGASDYVKRNYPGEEAPDTQPPGTTPSTGAPRQHARPGLGPASFARGGIVSVNAHEGEMILPPDISRGLQGMINSISGNSDTNETFTSAKRSAESLISWIGGMIAPHVQIVNWEELIDKWQGFGGKPGTEPNAPGGTAAPDGGVAPGSSPGAELSTGTAAPSDTTNPNAAPLDRAKFAEELQKNPALRDKILRIASNEQGTNQEGTQAVLESLMNRAAARGTSLARQARWTGEGGYYAQGSMGRGALEDPKQKAILEASLAKVLAGSNISNYATDNASGDLAKRERASGAFTYASSYGGETFFTPGTASGQGIRNKYAAWRAGQPSGGAPGGANVPQGDIPQGGQPPRGSAPVSSGDPHDQMSGLVDQALRLKGVTIDNPTLRAFVKHGSGLDPTGIAWCAALVSSLVKSVGGKSAGNIASDWMKWGHEISLDQMRKGDVGVALHGAVGAKGSHAVLMTGAKMLDQAHQWWVQTIGREHNQIALRWRRLRDMHFRRADGDMQVSSNTPRGGAAGARTVNAPSTSTNNYYISSTNPRDAANEIDRINTKHAAIHTKNMRTHQA